jgi:hypothetical protein
MCKTNSFYNFSINFENQSKKLCYIQHFEGGMVYNLLSIFKKEGLVVLYIYIYIYIYIYVRVCVCVRVRARVRACVRVYLSMYLSATTESVDGFL